MQTPQMNPGLMQAVPMDGFQKGWEAGLARKREEELRRSMAALALNPYDPKTQEAAAPHNPQAVMEVRQQQQAQTEERAKAWKEYAGNLAAWAETPQQRDQAIDYLLSQNNPEVDPSTLQRIKAIPPEQWPQVRMAIMAEGGIKPPQQGNNVVVIDGVAMDKATGQPLFESPYDRIIPGPNGSFYRVPRQGFGRGGQQGPQPQGEVVQGELPPGWTYEDEGDASGNAGGGFRDPPL